MELICKTKCFVNGQLFAPGETLELKPELYKEAVKKGKDNPYIHFIEKKDFKPAPVKPEEKEPKTFHEMQKKGVGSEELFK